LHFVLRRPRATAPGFPPSPWYIKLALEAQKTWKKIKGYKWIPQVIEGATFVDGELTEIQEQVA
jgi:hypothetical protein